ncbi:hypothetical protein EIP91_006229 [Steccherinum ochraceum]|uniref:DUF7727 domain-containing protein n=1 Tax=Steccherinum ochraceum TaxID=92696 RepID=A0A4R0R620_9APHY|nr:hypothetical protein EIP91_006229 [Steccherinum ochraceum]
MGNLIWHEYARFVSLTASAYTIWAAFWGVLYRKFFWDFVGGIVRNPGGIQPNPNVSVMITLIVKAPVIQIFAFVLGCAIVMVEYPAPFLKNTIFSRSLLVKTMMLLVQSVLAILFYQGTNGAIWSLVAMGCYIRAQMLGEKVEEAKQNRGRGGKA